MFDLEYGFYWPVWPDLTKFRELGEILEVFGKHLSV